MAVKHVNYWGGTFTDDDFSNDIWGSWYNDTIFARGGDDNIDADDGDDKVYGDSGDDYVRGGDGNDKLYGGDDDDTLFGDADNDIVDGGAGNDHLHGGSGDDTLRGGEGDDSLIDTSGQDKFYGGSGVDTLNYAAFDGKVDVTLNGEAEGTARQWVKMALTLGGPKTWVELSSDETYSIENVIGSAGNDRIVGDDNANKIEGNDGSDRLYGRGGNDTLSGGVGDDTIVGGAGYDTMSGYFGADTFVFNDGEFTTIGVDLQGHRFIDTVTDFDSTDRIDLSNIDADTTTTGNQEFHSVYGGVGGGFTGHAGELTVTRTAIGEEKDTWMFQGDVDGNGRADFMIEVHAWHGSSVGYML